MDIQIESHYAGEVCGIAWLEVVAFVLDDVAGLTAGMHENKANSGVEESQLRFSDNFAMPGIPPPSWLLSIGL